MLSTDGALVNVAVYIYTYTYICIYISLCIYLHTYISIYGALVNVVTAVVVESIREEVQESRWQSEGPEEITATQYTLRKIKRAYVLNMWRSSKRRRRSSRVVHYESQHQSN